MMNILSLALRYIKTEKKHSAAIVISIALSVALTVFSMSAYSTYRNIRYRYAVSEYGSYHAAVWGLTDEQAQLISHNAAFSDSEVFRYQTIDHSRFDDDGRRLMTSVYAADPDDGTARSKGTIYYFTAVKDERFLPENILADGRLPQSENEIVLSDAYGFRTGDKVKIIKALQRSSGNDLMEDETVESSEKIYTVCGVTKEKYTSWAVGCNYVYKDDDFPFKGICKEAYGIYVRFRDSNAHLQTVLMDVCEKAGVKLSKSNRSYTDMGDISFHFNEGLLSSEIVGSEARAQFITGSAFLYVAVLLILASSRMIIDCEFELTAEKKRRHMGLLMSIGADDGQLVGITTAEGIILGLIAVPLGLIVGYITAAAVCSAVGANEILMSAMPYITEIKPVINFGYMALAAVTGMGWVFFSAYGTAVRIKKVNPVEATKGYSKRGKQPYPRRPYRHSCKPKYFLKSISYSSVRMEKKRFISAMISVTISMTLIVSVGYGASLFRHWNDICVGVIRNNNEYDEKIVGNMSMREREMLTDKIRESGKFTVLSSDVAGNIKHLTARDQTIMTSEGEKQVSFRIMFFPGNYCEYKDGIPVTEISGINGIIAGEKISIVPDKIEDVHIDGLPVIEIIPSNSGTVYSDESDIVTIILPNEVLDNYEQKAAEKCPGYEDTEMYNYISMRDNDFSAHEENMEFISQLTDDRYYVDDIMENEELHVYSRISELIRLIGTAAAVVSALIAVSNIINITVSGINESRKSYALLRAAGMTDAQLEKAVMAQVFFPIKVASAVTLLFVLAAIGIAKLGLFVPDVLKTSEVAVPQYALMYYAAAVIGTFAVSLISALASVREIEEMNVADAVRSDV